MENGVVTYDKGGEWNWDGSDPVDHPQNAVGEEEQKKATSNHATYCRA